MPLFFGQPFRLPGTLLKGQPLRRVLPASKIREVATRSSRPFSSGRAFPGCTREPPYYFTASQGISYIPRVRTGCPFYLRPLFVLGSCTDALWPALLCPPARLRSKADALKVSGMSPGSFVLSCCASPLLGEGCASRGVRACCGRVLVVWLGAWVEVKADMAYLPEAGPTDRAKCGGWL